MKPLKKSHNAYTKCSILSKQEFKKIHIVNAWSKMTWDQHNHIFCSSFKYVCSYIIHKTLYIKWRAQGCMDCYSCVMCWTSYINHKSIYHFGEQYRLIKALNSHTAQLRSFTQTKVWHNIYFNIYLECSSSHTFFNISKAHLVICRKDPIFSPP